jgi:hypothetical protein
MYRRYYYGARIRIEPVAYFTSNPFFGRRIESKGALGN